MGALLLWKLIKMPCGNSCRSDRMWLSFTMRLDTQGVFPWHQLDLKMLRLTACLLLITISFRPNRNGAVWGPFSNVICKMDIPSLRRRSPQLYKLDNKCYEEKSYLSPLSELISFLHQDIKKNIVICKSMPGTASFIIFTTSPFINEEEKVYGLLISLWRKVFPFCLSTFKV
ncbi:uncharacterized protein LOC126481945 [Schistocerca serialis cubense]|uniref:uncharacterized protein LOC126481945 n=1 Tax=Schistocerca serialis cubense TaxID=2023355 RepID=UPI00214E864C|nr:uncharacterized protein LOC126481945 [Schistocerca serialis cubense]